MRVLLTGAAGQLGQALRELVPEGVELIATAEYPLPAPRPSYSLLACGATR